MAKGDALPDGHHVTRWIKPKFVGKHDDGTVILDHTGKPDAIFPGAYELREDEETLSVTWLEHFGSTLAEQLPKAAAAVGAEIDLKPNSAFSVGKVSQIKDVATEHGHKVRVVEDPDDTNTGHSEVRRYPRDADELFHAMAEDVFRPRYLYGSLIQTNWTP